MVKAGICCSWWKKIKKLKSSKLRTFSSKWCMVSLTATAAQCCTETLSWTTFWWTKLATSRFVISGSADWFKIINHQRIVRNPSVPCSWNYSWRGLPRLFRRNLEFRCTLVHYATGYSSVQGQLSLKPAHIDSQRKLQIPRTHFKRGKTSYRVDVGCRAN